MVPTPSEAEGLRTYLHKGGPDRRRLSLPSEWAVFETAMRRVLPNSPHQRLDVSHPIYNTFFAITSLDIPYPGTSGPGR